MNKAQNYSVRYVDKFLPSSKDIGGDISLAPSDLTDPAKLAKAMRKGGALGAGGRVRQFRVEAGGRVVAFPTMPGMTTYWHSIILTPK